MAAIYQEARPFTFEQVVGQEHVKDVLVAALSRGRIGHAYLFSGPRGVGKTTTARLLAMAVNCEAPDLSKRPCGVCEPCNLIRSGSHPDVIELDAASNNSVDDIRDLREKVRLSSMRGGKRVWVLDEAHMLSRAAANALLKTLEEPPDNLVFILATTEPEKLPPTILSRCQHFRFRRLSETEIVSKLSRLCSERATQADDDALRLVARAADGAMRDAESLLERLLTTGNHIVRDAVESALGLPPSERMQRLAGHLINCELKPLLEECSSLYHDGFAPSSLAEQLIKTLRDALFVQVTGNTGFTLQVAQDALLRLIHTLDDELERFTRRDDLFALEVTLIKGITTLSGNRPAAAVSVPADAAPSVPARTLPDFDPHSRPAAAPIKSPAKAAPTAQVEAPNKSPTLSWHAVKRAASTQLKAFLNPAQDKIDGHSIHLLFDERHSFHFNQLKSRADELIALIREVYGEPFDLTIAGPGESLQKKG